VIGAFGGTGWFVCGRRRYGLASGLASLAALALLIAPLAGPAQAAHEAEGTAAELGEGEAQLALEFGEPDPDPEHPDPDEQRVLEDPAGWPWWAWTILLIALIGLGVPLALLLMRKVERARSRPGEREE
jgi:MFS family permease